MSKPRRSRRSTEGKFAGIPYWAGAGISFLLAMTGCMVMLEYDNSNLQMFISVIMLLVGFVQGCIFILAAELSTDTARICYMRNKSALLRSAAAMVGPFICFAVLWLFADPMCHKLWVAGLDWFLWLLAVSFGMVLLIPICLWSLIVELASYPRLERQMELGRRIHGTKR